MDITVTMEATTRKKIDIHTHILPGIDDGARDFDESINIINYLKKHGFTDIVLTSHYIDGSKYNCNQKDKSKLLKELKEKLDDININLYLGNEVYISENIIDLYKNKEISTINKSKYMLIELPLSGHINNIDKILCDLNNNGIVPIIAHPERYVYIQDDYNKIYDLLEFGCLLQCNICSLTNRYGKKARKLMKWLLKKNLVSFVATDIHRVNKKNKIDKSYKKLLKLIGSNKYDELTYKNMELVINNKNIDNDLEYLINNSK